MCGWQLSVLGRVSAHHVKALNYCGCDLTAQSRWAKLGSQSPLERPTWADREHQVLCSPQPRTCGALACPRELLCTVDLGHRRAGQWTWCSHTDVQPASARPQRGDVQGEPRTRRALQGHAIWLSTASTAPTALAECPPEVAGSLHERA